MDRRSPLQPFQENLIKTFLDGRKICSIQLLEHGKSNTNYKITLNDGCSYVFRILSNRSPEYVFRILSNRSPESETPESESPESENLEHYVLEHYVMELVKNLVPVPKELFRGEGCAVYSFLPGQPLHAVPECAGEAAKALVKIMSVSFEAPGQLRPDGSISQWPFEGLKGFIEKMIDIDAVSHWLGNRTIDQLRSLVDKESNMIQELDNEHQLVHGDFNPGNILIHDGKVSGILDWEYAHSGTPYMDIGNLLRNIDERYHVEIYSGLLQGGMNLPSDWKARAQLVDITSQLEFLTSERSDEFKKGCVCRIKHYLTRSIISPRN
jgi:hypothetical protein